MKLNEVITTRPLLEKIAAKEMDAAAAKEFAEFTIAMLKEFQAFEVKRAGYFEKYGEVSGEEENKKISILPENEKKFNAAIKRSLSKEVDVAPFDIASLGINIAPADLINALPLFK